MCKSAINLIDSQNIKHSEEFFVIQGLFDRNEKEENIYCAVKQIEGKVFKRNGKEYQKLADHVGFVPLVIISPADSSLIVEGSEERRRYLNGVISQFDRFYLDEVIRYNRVLIQRNKLLKDFNEKRYFSEDLLDIIDLQLVKLGNTIYTKRKEFVEKLIPIFQKYYTSVSGDAERVSLFYQSQLDEGNFETQIKSNINKDRAAQFTTIGIHKDDLILLQDGHPIKKEGSQGQQKTYLLALKLAQFDFIREVSGIRPILLLDDIFDKLDIKRVENFIRLVSDNGFGQIFITDTNKSRLDEILAKLHSGFKLFKVEDGMVREIS
jgi:DNA replication and repair protein RecF